jgi:hypothetical protein
MREAARALAEADALVAKYGADPAKDGAVIRFTKAFLPPSAGSGPRASEAIYSILETNDTLANIAAISSHAHTFDFAGIRAKGLWFLTGGGSTTPQGAEWEDLLLWMTDGIPVEGVEWLSYGYAAALDGGKEDEEKMGKHSKPSQVKQPKPVESDRKDSNKQ